MEDGSTELARQVEVQRGKESNSEAVGVANREKIYLELVSRAVGEGSRVASVHTQDVKVNKATVGTQSEDMVLPKDPSTPSAIAIPIAAALPTPEDPQTERADI